MAKSLFTLVVVLLTTTASAHEFWLQPHNYTPSAGEPVIASVRAGEHFEGVAYPYLPSRLKAARLFHSEGSKPISGQTGLYPAIRTSSEGEGLQILSWQSTPSTINYQQYDEFRQFLQEEGLNWVDDRHRQRGLPDSGFIEAYSRYAKTLMQIGSGGQDQTTGMDYEWLALGNPYQRTDAELSEPKVLPLQLLSRDKPVPDAKVTVFRKTESNDDATTHMSRTDANGTIALDISATGEYLVSAVVMTELMNTAMPWHSHWVSLTFKVE